MKSMYIEKKYLVINEDTSIYICGGSLRYMDNKGERFEIIENIDKNDVRQMIKRNEIPYSDVKKFLFRRELFYFQKQDKILKMKVKDIKSVYIRYSYKRDKGIFSFNELKKRLPSEEYEEFLKDKLEKYELYL